MPDPDILFLSRTRPTESTPERPLMPDVEISERRNIPAGATVGSERLREEEDPRVCPKVVFQEDVEVGAHACISKSMHLRRHLHRQWPLARLGEVG